MGPECSFLSVGAAPSASADPRSETSRAGEVAGKLAAKLEFGGRAPERAGGGWGGRVEEVAAGTVESSPRRPGGCGSADRAPACGQRVAGSLPGQRPRPCFRPGPQQGVRERRPHAAVSLPLLKGNKYHL